MNVLVNQPEYAIIIQSLANGQVSVLLCGDNGTTLSEYYLTLDTGILHQISHAPVSSSFKVHISKLSITLVV